MSRYVYLGLALMVLFMAVAGCASGSYVPGPGQADHHQADHRFAHSAFSYPHRPGCAGAVTTVTITHALGSANAPITPLKMQVQPASANARGAPAFYITADTTNLTLTFASALTAATSYSWNWWAER